MQYDRVKKLFYAFAFLDDFILIYPLYALLFTHSGLGAAQISSLYIGWSLTGFLCEVPAGSVADKYPRRNVMLASVLVKALGFSCWLAYPHYLGFLLGFILWGISGALISGTEEALVYDELKRADKAREYTKVTGMMRGLRMLGVVLASFAASPLSALDYPAMLVISVGTILLSAVPVWLLPRVAQQESIAELHYLAHIRQGFQLVLHNRKLLFIIAYAAIATGLTADEYYSLFLHEKGFSVAAVAAALGVVSLFGMAGSLLAHRLERRRLPLRWLLFLPAVCLLLAAMASHWLVAALLSVVDIYMFAVAVLCNSYTQYELADTHRTTATSFSALVVELGALLTFGIFAIASQSRSYTFGMQVLSCTIGLLAIVYGTTSHYKKIAL